MNVIHICYSLDNNGINHLLTSVYSLLKNKSNKTTYKIIILYVGLSKNQINLIKSLSKNRNGVSFSFINCYDFCEKYKIADYKKTFDNQLFKFYTKLKWPLPMFFYYFLPEILPVSIDKVIYLDIDTLILKDLSKLYNLKINTSIAGVSCYDLAYVIKRQNFLNNFGALREYIPSWPGFEDKDITKYENIINSGVILINFKKFIKKFDTQEKIKNLFQKNKEWGYPDQELLAKIFQKDITLIDVKYNFQVHFFADNFLESSFSVYDLSIEKLKNFISWVNIIHYTVRPKPEEFFNVTTFNIIKKIGIRNFWLLLYNPLIDRDFEINDNDNKKMIELGIIYRSYFSPFSTKTRIYELSFFIYFKTWFMMANEYKIYE